VLRFPAAGRNTEMSYRSIRKLVGVAGADLERTIVES
jgi:molybdenum-dependent DNA-binding transcriptional regulator ModE